MGRFLFAAVLGLLSGILLAPKKGSDLRCQMSSRSMAILDKAFNFMAMHMEPAKPRQPEEIKLVNTPVEDDAEAAEAMSRIKAALDGKDDNHAEKLAS